MDMKPVLELIQREGLTGIVICPDQSIRFFRDEIPHWDDGPAVIGTYGEEWLREGKLHREDGPAIEWMDGTKEWWINGDLHREEGPAITNADGSEEYWIAPKP